MQRKIVGSGLIMLECIRKEDGERIAIVNIYALCDIVLKRALWEEIKKIKQESQLDMWCIIGDFNYVCKNSKRVGASHRD